jgi:hypothetical protein
MNAAVYNTPVTMIYAHFYDFHLTKEHIVVLLSANEMLQCISFSASVASVKPTASLKVACGKRLYGCFVTADRIAKGKGHKRGNG